MPQFSSTDDWYYRMLGEEFGPVTRHVLESLIVEGQLDAGDEVRNGSAGLWMPSRHLTLGGGDSHSGGTVMSLESLSDAGFDSLADGAAAAQDEWFYQSLGQDWGPVSFEELLTHARQGDVSPDDQIRLGHNGKWRRAGSMGRLMAVMPYAVPGAREIPTGGVSSRPVDADFETAIPLKESARTDVAPPPGTAQLPPPPQMMPPQMMPMPGYAAPHQMVPGWPYGVPPMQNPAADMGWYAWLNGVECGPMDQAQVMNWAQTGRITPNDYLKQGKYSQWSPAKTVPGLAFQTAPPAPPPAPVRQAVAPVPAPPVAALPAVQLPPPPKAAAAALVPAPAAAPLPRPVPAEPPKPVEAPPPRPPMNEWGTSTVKSTYRPGVTGVPAAKKPAAKSKQKSSGGGGLDVGELMRNKFVLGGLGVVVLVVAGYFGIGMLPEGTRKLKTAYNDLKKLHKEIEGKSGDSSDEKAWKTYGDSMKKKVNESTKAIGTSKHKAQKSLTKAKSALTSALGAKKKDDVDKKLDEAGTKLGEAKKDLGL